MARRLGVLAGVCVSDQVCASFMCGMWHVHYPFLKERYIKEIKKGSSAKKKVFFSASHSPLSDRRFNLSTYQQLTIAVASFIGLTHLTFSGEVTYLSVCAAGAHLDLGSREDGI